ncbi:MAG: histone deacetylase family protein [Deltaproteobacteria bacterium]|nr:histone deacetylase family protein [Deltaproteobacteria bacterium]
MQRNQLTVIYHDLCLNDYLTASCETPDRVQSVMKALRQHYPVRTPAAATEDDILLVHLESILTAVKRDTVLYEAAAVAAGGAILAAELALKGQPAFAAVRPPGHHASPGSHWGFCFFNNVAISLERLLRRGEISQALVLDIDLHFGDGTDNFFMGRKEVVVANIQENDRGRFLQEVDRALGSNDYDIIAISAGFDRHARDWGGTLTTEDYFTIGRNVQDYARAKCEGRRYAVLEGGYNIGVLGENALALCKGMEPS